MQESKGVSATTKQTEPNRTAGKRLRYLAAASALFLAVSLSALRIYIATPHAAAMLSNLIASRINQPFAIESLKPSTGGITLTGVVLGNPVGFPQRTMISAQSVIIVPDWPALIRGRRSLALIEVNGARIAINRDSSGIWNFDRLRKRLASGKPGPGLAIARLAVNGGKFSLNGQDIGNFSLQLQNLDTRGSSNATLTFNFEDNANDRFILTGSFRPGKEPAYDLRLAAPEMNLAALPTLTGKRLPFPLSGKGELLVNSTMNGTLLSADAKFNCSGVPVNIGNRATPLAGSVSLRGTYDLKSDQGVIEKGDISVGNLLRLHASAKVDGVKTHRAFSLLAGLDRLDLARLNALLPEPNRSKVNVGGTLEAKRIAIAGNAPMGITEASGTITVTDGSLNLDAHPIARKMQAAISLARAESGFSATVRIYREKSSGTEPLQALDTTGTVQLDSRLKLVSAEFPELSAQVMGTEMTGKIGFAPNAPSPLTASVNLPAVRLLLLNDLLASRNTSFESGTATVTMTISGRDSAQFRSATGIRLSGIKGASGKNRFDVNEARFNSTIVRSGKSVNGSGDVRLIGAVIGSRKIGGGFDFAFTDRNVTFERSRLVTGSIDAAAGKISLRIPVKQAVTDGVRYPVSAEIADADIRTGELSATGLSGRLQASYAMSGEESWLEGGAEMNAGGISLHGDKLGAPALRVNFSRQGAAGLLNGTLLGGAVNGHFSINPFAPENGATGDLELKGAVLGEAKPFIPRNTVVRPTKGFLDVAVQGRYSFGALPEADFTIKVRDLSLVAKNGKPLLDAAAAGISGSLADNRLFVSNGRVGAGEGVSLAFRGELQDIYSPKREGIFSAKLDKTDINRILDSFANSLPRLLQEATGTGSIGGEAELFLKSGKPTVKGEIVLDGVTLGVDSQKLSIGMINGTIPISFDRTAARAKLPDQHPDFTRSNFPLLVEQLSKPGIGDHRIVIDGVAFGPLKLGATTLMLRAGNGLTELTSLQSSLYDGALLGKGYLSLAEGYSYGADLLIDGLSLSQLCNTFPKIKGYISGRVEGVLSLSGGSPEKEGLIGLTELWTRETKGERMLVSREFLQKLADKKLSGFFFSDDRPYDRAEISASLEKGYLEFYDFAITHTNFFGVRDLSVSVAESHNRIALDHLFNSIKNAATRGKGAVVPPSGGTETPVEKPGEGFNWEE